MLSNATHVLDHALLLILDRVPLDEMACRVTAVMMRVRPGLSVKGGRRQIVVEEIRHHFVGEQLGGFKWSSQHFDGSCDEHSKTALGSFWAGALVLTRSTAGGRARGAAAILGSDCGGHGE